MSLEPNSTPSCANEIRLPRESSERKEMTYGWVGVREETLVC